MQTKSGIFPDEEITASPGKISIISIKGKIRLFLTSL